MNLIWDSLYFIQNEYLDKYEELIKLNEYTKQEKYITQKHHIIPKCYYKITNQPVDNSNSNIVNLIYKDHILAHYYLCLCTKGILKYKLINALNHLTARKWKLEDIKFLDSLDKLDIIKSSYRFTEEHLKHLKGHKKPGTAKAQSERIWTYKQKLKTSLSNRCRQKPQEYINIISTKWNNYYENNKGFNKNKHYYTNGEIDILTYECPEGFTKGRCKKYNNKGVLQFDLNHNFIAEFKTQAEASKHIGLASTKNGICCCCKGLQHSAYGYIWEYKKD